MHEPDQHVSPIKNWKQLVVVVVLAFIVPITVIILLSQFVTGHPADARPGRQRRAEPHQARRRRGARRGERAQGPAHRRAGLQPGLQDVPRSGARRRAEGRRQDRVGQGHRAGTRHDGRARGQGHSRDAAEGRQSGFREHRGRARRRLHGEQGRRELEGAPPAATAAGRGAHRRRGRRRRLRQVPRRPASAARRRSAIAPRGRRAWRRASRR